MTEQWELDQQENERTGSSWDKCLSPESPDGEHCWKCLSGNVGSCHFEGCEFLW
jgi:hypothetical protein